MITPVGLLTLPLVVAVSLLSREWLFRLTVASFPLFMVVFFQVGGTEVRAVYVLGALLMVRQILDNVSRPRERPPFQISLISLGVALFLAVIMLSLFMPGLLENLVYVVSTETGYQNYDIVETLRFTRRNVTQTVFPAFMVLLFFSVRAELRRPGRVETALRWLAVGGVVVFASGIAMQILYGLSPQVGLSRFMWFFRGNPDVGTVAIRMNSPIWPFPRMFSLAGEPGYTGFFFTMMAGLSAPGAFLIRGEGTRRIRWLFLAAFAGAILTASTTAFVGLLLLVVAFGTLPLIRWKRLKGVSPFRLPVALSVAAAGVAVFVVAIAFVAGPERFELLGYLETQHLAKLQGVEGSGTVRLSTVRYTLDEVVQKSPVLGVGFGSHRTTALATSILGGTGIIGLLAFLFLNTAGLLKAGSIYRQTNDPTAGAIALGVLLALAAGVPTMLVGKSQVALTYAYYWFILAVADRGVEMVGRDRMESWEAEP